MANLRVNKITGTEVFETTGSVQFDGSGDYLTLSYSNTNFDWWTESFTIEAWVYASSWSGSSFFPIVGNMEPTSSSNNWSLAPLSTGALRFYYFNGGGVIINSTGTLPAGQWNHIAVTHSSSTIRLFINGVLDTTTTVSGTPQSSNAIPLTIGQYNNTSANGHISNLRILKGTALYTSNFTPPTRELTVIPNTVLLCCQSTTRANEERTGKTITVNGNAVANELTPGLLTDRVKSGGDSVISGSVEFDGNDYLLESTGADGFNGGLGDWTVEAWMYCTDASQPDVLINGLTSSTDRFYINFIGQTLYVGDFSINNIAIGGVKQVNSWFHIAVTKSSSTYRAFINGILIGSSTSALVNSPLTSLQIGYRGSQNYYTKGFISNLRIVKGTALYTSNFIPPTRELKRLPGTVLLCCKNTSDPTAEETGKTITPYGSLVYNPPELVNDGAFNSASSWPSAQADWSISGGRATINSANSGYDFLGILTNRTINGQLYELRFDISSWTAGRLELAQSDSSNIGVSVSGNGPYAFRFRYTGPTNGNVSLFSYTDTTASFTLDNLSLKQVASVPSPPFTPSVGSDGSVTFDGVTKINTPNYFYLPTGNTEDRGRGRGVFGGGVVFPTVLNTIDYINIQSQGNAQDFGDLTVTTRRAPGSCSSSTRGLFAGGYSAPSYRRSIEFITLSTQSNSTSFGDLTDDKFVVGGLSNNTRGIFGGGEDSPASHNIIDYVTIASLGNAIDFGDMLTNQLSAYASCSSSSRGLFAGGFAHIGSSLTNVIQYVTISSTGNSQDFGDLTVTRASLSGCSSPIRGIFGGGNDASVPSVQLNTIDYVTIASTGNATDFGDLISVFLNKASCSSPIRGIFAGGVNPAAINSIEFVTISSTGNGQDFGDLITARGQFAGCSDSHGGLG